MLDEENVYNGMNISEEILRDGIYNRFIKISENSAGVLEEISFTNEDKFNFSFDVLDFLADKCKNAEAMLHVSKDGKETRLTFGELAELTNKAANYFEENGIKRGDRVMLVLKRNIAFWICILAFHKIGAIAVPATNQLQVRDFEERFRLGEISGVCAISDDLVPEKINEAERCAEIRLKKFIADGEKDGWNCFYKEFHKYSTEYKRKENSPCGSEPMLMFFTSGTTGQPKMVIHDYKYPLGHFITAKYWHNIKPGGLHLTVSDTGWGKALWGKLYGQWLSGASVFVYEFDRFSASELLPMFKKYNITTFCAPPTVYRMIVKERLEDYDLSSVRHASTAGETLNPEVFKRFEESTGLKIMEGFGQTETTLIIANLRGSAVKIGSMGKPIPSLNVGLVNSKGEPCKIGEVGEIVIYDSKNDVCGLFKGYFKRDDLTCDVKYNGAYHTNDLARMDEEGFYWYVGRKDDIIKSSGYKISPCEVENVIMELPFVLECAVSSEPDEIRGQIVKATVILTKETDPNDELKTKIQKYVKEKTAPYKYPRKIVFTNGLPKTISGKVKRKEL